MLAREQRRPLIVPIFIPNQGCPHRCIFCLQEKITAQPARPVNEINVKQILDEAIKSANFDVRREPEVAFYGGTFTGLPFEKISELLWSVTPYLNQGFFRSIRVSTRPDSLDSKRLDLMKRLGVTTVELGVQSMNDEALELSQRGHTARDTIESVHMLKNRGFKVGIQLMPGLPGDSEEQFTKTVEAVIKLHPDMVRLYPAVVINGTELAEWFKEGRYQPLQLDEAVRICRKACVCLEGKGIPVIRIGLMSSPCLLQEGRILAGPWHEAFGFLVRSDIHQRMIEPCLPGPGEAEKIRLRAPMREIPLVRGYKNNGIRLVEDKTGAKVTGVIPDESVPSGRIGVDKIS